MTRICDVADCTNKHAAKGLCEYHYRRHHENSDRPLPPAPTVQPAVIICPDDLIPLVAQLVENDARNIFRVLWRTIGEWHLQGRLEDAS